MTCQFVPPYLLQQLAASRAEAAACCEATLAVDEEIRSARIARLPAARVATAGEPVWTVHSAANGSGLPGTPARAAGQPEVGDPAVDEAAAGIAAVLALFAEVYGRASYDGKGAPVSLSVHYRRDYDNAFWDGTQLVLGDGDGTVFGRFTRPVDVLGHEFGHAVTEHTAALAYQGQSGALNESVSDVFASCLKQRLLGQDAIEADWLIGQGIFLPGIHARGLRDMAAPGTAYDDPALGKDPQGGHLDDYVETTDDNGGVHLNSGIPNRAFQLAATGIGGSSWEGAGAIWYAALTGGQVTSRTGFAEFAAATVAVAGPHADVVRDAWAQVGIDVSRTTAPTPMSTPMPTPMSTEGTGPLPATVVSVKRTGGFAGRADRRPGRPRRRGPARRGGARTAGADRPAGGAWRESPPGHVRLRVRPVRLARHGARAAPHRRPAPPRGPRPGGGAGRGTGGGAAVSRCPGRLRPGRGPGPLRRAGSCRGRPGPRSRPGGPAARARCSRG